MDANGTRFQLLLGYENWANCLDGPTGFSLRAGWEASPPDANDNIPAWNERRQDLTLQPRLFKFASSGPEELISLERRRGAGRDRYDNWYWIADNKLEILVNSAGTRQTTHFWTTGDGLDCPPTGQGKDFQVKEIAQPVTPLVLSGLTITEDHYLVVGVQEPAGLLIFDLHAGGPPRQFGWYGGVPFIPFDLAARPGGGVWILDRENKRYWALDRLFGLTWPGPLPSIPGAQAAAFQLADGAEVRLDNPAYPAELVSNAALSLVANDPISIEGLSDGTVLILDGVPGQRFALVYRYYLNRRLGQPFSTEAVLDLVEPGQRAALSLRAYDIAFVPEHQDADQLVSDRLYLLGENGNQAFSFELAWRATEIEAGPPKFKDLDFQPLNEYLPLHLFGGKALVGSPTQAYYDFNNRWIPLVAQPRPRYAGQASVYTPLQPGLVLDGHAPGCVWHTLMLDGCIPYETSVRVSSRTADELFDLPRAAWHDEPDLYLRGDGSELPFISEPRSERSGTWQLIFQQAAGRYLQLKLVLAGNGRATPSLRALRAYYPRFSYLQHYLPAIYRQDSRSASFMDRFLANLEGFYTALEDKIANVQILFDVRSAPADMLEWLAGWFGIAMDPAWDEPRQRLFIKHAMDFFQYRGTIRGLQMALHLVLNECVDESIFTGTGEDSPIRIIEKYRLRHTPGLLLGDPTNIEQPRQVEPGARWQPNQGSAVLHQLYRQFLDPELSQASIQVIYPLQEPLETITRTYWQDFSQAQLGFVPAADSDDLAYWQVFLQRRYSTITNLNAAYKLGSQGGYHRFSEVALPDHLPPDGPALQDWYQFEAVVLPMRSYAHQFTVLLPVPKAVSASVALYQQRLDLANRIIKLEKPTHTAFNVKFYWVAFRVGQARLGKDTLLDQGSRSPQLMPPVLLGSTYLAESYLAPNYPQNLPDRQIIGRDRLNNSLTQARPG